MRCSSWCSVTVPGALWQVVREAEKALKMSQRKDYYKILSLDRSANIRDIKRVRRKLACRHETRMSAQWQAFKPHCAASATYARLAVADHWFLHSAICQPVRNA